MPTLGSFPSYIFNNRVLNPKNVLGKTLYRFYGSTYNQGDWVDEIVGADATQTIGVNQPTVSTTPRSYKTPSFDGTNLSDTDYLNCSGISLLPTYSASGFYLWFCVFKLVALSPGPFTTIINPGTTDQPYKIDGSLGTFTVFSITTDTAVNDGNWHQIIVKGTASTGGLQMWLDGVLQSQTQTGAQFGFDWKSGSMFIGTFDDTGAEAFNGQLGAMGFAYSANDFSSSTIIDLVNALSNVYSYEPNGVSNLFCWYRSDLVTLTSGKVSTWPDKSGNARNLTTKATFSDANYITSSSLYNNLPAVGWTSAPSPASGWMLRNDGPFTQGRPFIIYAVMCYNVPNTTESNALGWICNDTSDSTFAWGLDADAQPNYHFTIGDNGITFSTADNVTATSAHVVAMQIQSTISQETLWNVYIDNYEVPDNSMSQTVTPGGILDHYYMGSCPSLTGGGMATQFSIAEMWIYSGIHDIATRKRLMQTYAGTHYGITVTP